MPMSTAIILIRMSLSVKASNRFQKSKVIPFIVELQLLLLVQSIAANYRKKRCNSSLYENESSLFEDERLEWIT
jgi:hypothetical protein